MQKHPESSIVYVPSRGRTLEYGKGCCKAQTRATNKPMMLLRSRPDNRHSHKFTEASCNQICSQRRANLPPPKKKRIHVANTCCTRPAETIIDHVTKTTRCTCDGTTNQTHGRQGYKSLVRLNDGGARLQGLFDGHALSLRHNVLSLFLRHCSGELPKHNVEA
jgi:hypothetical protein